MNLHIAAGIGFPDTFNGVFVAGGPGDGAESQQGGNQDGTDHGSVLYFRTVFRGNGFALRNIYEHIAGSAKE